MTPYVVSFFLFFEGGFMNKKIFIVCSKWCYTFIPGIVERLKQLGYDVILPNFYDDPMIEERIKKEMSKKDHIEFCRESFKLSRDNARNSDITLVLNANKIIDGVVYENYIGGATFLEMYDSYLEEHPIFLYNDIPKGMLYDEIEGMNPIVLNGDLFSILENDHFDIISSSNNLLKYFSKEELEGIKSCSDECLKAAIITRKLFSQKVDKAGMPYFEHLRRVSASLETSIQKAAGLLHDVVEDTDVTCKDLLEIGFSKEVVKIVFIVTKPIVDMPKMCEEERLALYESEIDSIIRSNNYDACILKQADMMDNYNSERLSLLPKEKQDWFNKKYEKQLIKLKKINEERR